MTAPAFLDELKKRPLVCDGAMGTRLQESVGAERAGSSLELLNYERPELVLAIHRSYVDAGADIIQTNTYGANGLQLARVGRPDAVAAVNRRAVELARAAAESACRPVWVAGTLGPLGTIRYDQDVIRPDQIGRVYADQAAALAAAGVDLFIVETMDDYREISGAMRAVRGYQIPIILQVETRDGETWRW
jgi:methionine synthase I (cobalamin-dependent)